MTGSPPALRILMVEDSPADAELVLRALRALERPIEHTRVASAPALHQSLSAMQPDVVLSDFELPGFGGLSALRICRERVPEVPFLFVSGTIGEELAVEALRDGASDYVLKDNLGRLPSAVQRAVEAAQARLERRRIEAALRESEARFRAIVESSKDWVWEIDRDARTLYSNDAVTRILGYSPDDLVGKSAIDFMVPEDRQLVEQRLRQLIAAGEGWNRWRLRWRHRDGSIRVLESSASPYFDQAGRLNGYRGVDEDVTTSLAQARRIHQLARMHAVLAATSSAALRADSREAVLAAACRIAVEHGEFLATCIGVPGVDGGLELASAHGEQRVVETVAEIGRRMRGVTDPAGYSAGLHALRSGVPVFSPEIGSDPRFPEWVRALTTQAGVASQAILPLGTPPWGVLGLYMAEPHDFEEDDLGMFHRLMTEVEFAVEFVAKAEELEYLAYHDRVSGLPNREAFRHRLQRMLRAGPATVALVGIERFGAIAQSRGRAFADALLRQVGQRFTDSLPRSAEVAHLEAQTFALAHPTTTTPPFGRQEVEAFLEAMALNPVLVDGEAVHVDFTAGVVLTEPDERNPETVEHAALAALDEGRLRGEPIYAFDERLRGRSARQLELRDELRVALERNEFELHYQPKFDATQQLVGAEALLRWRHPERGLVSPGEFIPVLEQCGLIVPVGRWVMGDALRTVTAWRSARPGLRVAVNVSSRELRHREFLAHARSLLQPGQADQAIDIELTESLLMEDVSGSMHLLDSLRDLGCRVSIDDFGTGYSSLNYLATLPVDTIKIDQSFVAGMTQSPQTLSLVTVIINLAHSLSLDVVAEGVEEEGQLQLLRLLQCDVMQGYLLGRPVPADEFEARYVARPPSRTED